MVFKSHCVAIGVVGELLGLSLCFSAVLLQEEGVKTLDLGVKDDLSLYACWTEFDSVGFGLNSVWRKLGKLKNSCARHFLLLFNYNLSY